MPIINPLPYTIANGNPVDATPVEANLTQIVNNVNANAALVGGSASQEFLVATTANPAGAVPLAQAQQQFAALAGLATQVFNVANAATSTEAVPLGQAQADFAALNGSSSQVFNVANAATSTEAVPLGQAQANFATITSVNNAQNTANTALSDVTSIINATSLNASVPGNAALYGGLQFRWGTVTIGGAGSTPVSYIQPFPNTTTLVLVSNTYSGTGTPGANAPAAGSYTASGFTLGSTQAATITYFAVGS